MATTAAFDWKALEQTLLDAYLRQALQFLADHPSERIYAFALTGLYREEDGPIYLPTLACNSEQAYIEDHADSLEPDDAPDHLGHLRFNPPDWRWPDLADEAPDLQLRAAEEALMAEANASTVAHWTRTEGRLIKSLSKVCKALSKALKQSPAGPLLTRDFIVWLDLPGDEEGVDAARQCLGDKMFARIFSGNDENALERRRVAALPLAQQLRYHIGCLLGRPDEAVGLSRERARALRESAQDALFLIGGADAAHALVPVLDVPDEQWRAAFMLARIGHRDDTVIAALRGHLLALHRHKAYGADFNWCANALAGLGDSEWLLARLDDQPPLDASHVAGGIAYPYQAWNSHDNTHPIALDYRPLESALAHAQAAALGKALQHELEPGVGYCTLRAGDVNEVLRGLESPCALIRLHAAAIMGERRLGTHAAPRLLPALAECILKDPEPKVRRLALLSMQDWKQAATPWSDAVARVAENDDSPEVRQMAAALLRTFNGK